MASVASRAGRTATLAAAQRSRSAALFLRIIVVVREAADPDIAEANGIVVVLQHEGLFGRVGRVGSDLAIDHGAHGLLAIVHEDVVHEDGEIGWPGELFALEAWGFEDDVVGLPLPRGTRGVGERRPLAIDGAGLSIGVGGIVESVE